MWWGAATVIDRTADDWFVLRAQAEVTLPQGSQYRVDFLVEPVDQTVAASPDWTPLAVELDGHDFHERTREQVALRDRRDRDLQAAGWKVFHFSFAEFTKRPMDCVAEVLVYARKQHNRIGLRDYVRRHGADSLAPNKVSEPSSDAGV